MHHPFLPLLLLVLVPMAYAGWRLGWYARRGFRWAFATAVAAVLIIACIAGGIDFRELNRMKLVLAAVTTALLYLRAGGPLRGEANTAYRFALACIAACAWVVYANFGSFHASGPQRTFIHLHDVAHYYLGSKYATEIGYMELYSAIVRADSEEDATRLNGRQARDLRTNRLVDVAVLREDSAPVKARFTPARWSAFQQDVAFLRRALGQQFPDILLDHGYNPTPLWTLLGGMLANAVPAGSATGIFILTLVDPLLLVLLFLAIGWTFSLETALLSMIYFCIVFGASFGWVGGAFMRVLWLFAVVIGVCCIDRRRFVAAAVLFSLAALLRIFPIAFLVALGCKLAADALAARQKWPALRRMLVASALAATFFVLATAAAPHGLASWAGFRENMQRHLDNTAFNTIGLTQVLVHADAIATLGALAAPISAERQQVIYLIQLCTIVPATLAWFIWRSRREEVLGATVMAIVLLFVGLNLACYYYLVLMLLIIGNRDQPARLALIFAVEVATYALQLVEDRDAVIFFYRNVLVMLLLAALYGERRSFSAA